MIILGFVLFAAAVVVSVALIAQNGNMVTVRAFSWTWDVDARWLVVAGLALTAIAILGLMMMSAGAARGRRLRAERRVLASENRRLAEQGAAPAEAPASAPAYRRGRTMPSAAQDRSDARAGAPDNQAAAYPPDRYPAAPAGSDPQRRG